MWAKTKVAMLVLLLVWTVFPLGILGGNENTRSETAYEDVYLLSFDSPQSKEVLPALGIELIQDYNNGYFLAKGGSFDSSFLEQFGINVMMLPDRTVLKFPVAGYAFDTMAGFPTIPSALTATDTIERIVQFIGPMKSEWVNAVESTGVMLRDYVENYAYVARMTDEQAASVRTLPFVRWIGQYQPAFKVESRLLTMIGAIPVSVIAHDGVSEEELRTTLESLGAEPVMTWTTPVSAEARVDSSIIPFIARSSIISQIFWAPEKKTMDWQAGELHHFHEAWSPARSGLPSNLTGHSPGPDGIQGNADDVFEVIGIQDTGLDLQNADRGHPDFFKGPLGDRVIALRMRTGSCGVPDGRVAGTAHGTHVAGTAISNGFAWEMQFGIPYDDFEWDQSEAGVAPEGKLSMDCVITSTGRIQASPAYWDDEYADGAKTMSNSWGSAAGICDITCIAADTRIDASNDKMIVFAAGNDGPGEATTSKEAKGKNGLTIGASQNFRPEWFDSDNPNLIADFSSRSNPSERYKPDLVAVGTSVIAPLGCGEIIYWGGAHQPDWIEKVDVYNCAAPDTLPSSDGMGDYRYMPGTSAATPMAAGMYMLTREYFREVWSINNVDSHLAKAMLINGAVRMDPKLYEYPGVDQGWGRVDLKQSLFPPAPRTNQWEVGRFTSTGSWLPVTINRNVETADVPLKVTLVWVDQASIGLARDLDLIVRSPDGLIEYHGNQYARTGPLKGWTDPGDPGFDRINNVEQVEIKYPTPGLWSVEVKGYQVPSPAKFALVFAADVGPRKTYQVNIDTEFPTILTVAPGGSASLAFVVRNFGSSNDDIRVYHNSPTINVQLDWSVKSFRSGEFIDNMAIMTAPAGATPGMYPFRIYAESLNDPNVPKASDSLLIQVQVVNQKLPYWWKVTNESVDELDPSVLTFNSSGVNHVFIAYRKTTAIDPADLNHGGTNVWAAHNTLTVNHEPTGPWTQMVVSDWNDYPNDLRMLFIDWGGLAGRVVITWTGRDPLIADDNQKPYGRIAFSDPPYTTWQLRTIESNYGSNVYNSARVSFPVFRRAGGPNGTLAWVWEHLDFISTEDSQTRAVEVHATFSLDGGDTWSDCRLSQCKKIAPPAGNTNFYFFPNGVVDQNDVLWVFFYWRTNTGNTGRKLAVALWDGLTWDTGWSDPINIWDEGGTINIQFPAAVSTPEGGNRVLVAVTDDKGGLDKMLYTLYIQGNFGSGKLVFPAPIAAPGSPGRSPDFSVPQGPLGSAVSDANYNRRPVLNVVYTDDGVVWIPYMELNNPYVVPNMWTWSSRTAFTPPPPPELTVVTADAFAKGHQMSDTLTIGARSCVYEVWHENIAPTGQVNYEIYLAIYCSGWQSEPDNLGPLTINQATIPNPYNKTFPSATFKIKADITDINTGNNNIIAAELVMTDLTVSNPGSVSWANSWVMNLTGIDQSPTETAWLMADWLPGPWAVGECHRFWIRGQDNKTTWGPGDYVDVCVTKLPNKAPPPPVMLKAELTNTNWVDVTLTWARSFDDGGGFNDVARYKVWKSDSIRGPYFVVANVTATGAATYSWSDAGMGHLRYQNFFYYVVANDSTFDSQPTRLAAKFFRTMTDGGKQLVSFPLEQADYSPSVVFKTFGFDYTRTYDCGDGQDPWKSFKVGRTINDITALDIEHGYWVNMTSPGTLTVAGLVPLGVTIGLCAGWNLIGFPSFNTTYTFAEFDAALGGIVKAVEIYDPTTGPYHLQRLPRSQWATTKMEAGYGYWVLLSSTAVWVVPGA